LRIRKEIKGMDKKKIYQLFTIDNEYKCKVTAEEVLFLFGVNTNQDITAINEALTLQGYKIK
jgi:hypothetical protein